VASGDADVIPQVMARDYPDCRYITANMNRRLTAGLVNRIKDLPLAILVIEEDAARIEQHLRPASADVIASNTASTM